MLVYLRDGSAQTIVYAATLAQKLQIKLSFSPNHSILTPGQPAPALTLSCQVPGRVATAVPVFKSLVWLNPEKSSLQKQDSNSRSTTLEVDAITYRPTRQCAGNDPTKSRGSNEVVLWITSSPVHSPGKFIPKTLHIQFTLLLDISRFRWRETPAVISCSLYTDALYTQWFCMLRHLWWPCGLRSYLYSIQASWYQVWFHFPCMFQCLNSTKSTFFDCTMICIVVHNESIN